MTWPIREDNVIKLETDDARMIKWMHNVRPEDRISAVELRNRVQLNTMRECLMFIE